MVDKNEQPGGLPHAKGILMVARDHFGDSMLDNVYSTYAVSSMQIRLETPRTNEYSKYALSLTAPDFVTKVL